MKKLTALILAFVLVLSLSAIALAASGESNITVAVNSDNISVAVPLSFTITAKVDGGAATVPGNYEIVNSSAIPVKVDTIAVSLANSDWAFNSNAIPANTSPTSTGVNDIYLKLNGQVLKVQGATEPEGARGEGLPWNIGASSTKVLDLECSTSRLDQTTPATNLITITYVISAGSYTVTQEP